MTPKNDRLEALRAELEQALSETPGTPPRGTSTLYPAVVAGLSGEDVVVELSPRVTGAVPLAEFDAPPAPGTKLQVGLAGREDGLWLFSIRAAKTLSAWNEVSVGALVQGTVFGLNKGGLELKVGPLRAFLPASQVALEHVEDLASYAGQSLTCEVLEIDPAKKRLVVSRRAVLERERKAGRDKAVQQLAVDAVVRGKVTRMESYGAFVDLGGVEGLLHVSNLSHRRVEHPEELLKIGQEVEVAVISIEEGGKRIGLSRRRLEADPWEGLELRYHPDQVVTGRVRRLTNFGAFLEVEPGVEGLLHVSQIGGRGRDPSAMLKPGQELSVRIQSIDTATRRLSLSRLAPNGALLGSDEAAEGAEVREVLGQGKTLGTNLGSLLSRALRKD
jgi:ribosomal protein S1